MKKVFALVCVFCILAGVINVSAAAPDTKSTSVILATLNGQQIIYSKNPDEQLPPAELAKLMSAYTAYKIYGTDAVITVPDNLSEYVNYMETRMDLKGGEEIAVSSLIYGMIMGQANDAAIAIALYYGGTEDFVGRMNEYAKELGMDKSNFTNPTGNHDALQVTTAADMLKLYRAFYADKKLYDFIDTKNVVLPATNASAERTIWTKNHLMSRFIYLDYIYEYANAGLSSSSSRNGYSVISSASKGTKELVCIAMDSVYENGVNYSMTDATAMFDYGFDDFTTVTIAKQGDLLYEAKLKNQKGKDTLLLNAEKTLKGVVLDTELEKEEGKFANLIEKEVVIDEPVKAPLKKGDVVGKIVYKYNGNLFGELNLVAERDAKRSIFRTLFGGIGWFFELKIVRLIILAIIGAVILLLVWTVGSSNKKRRRRRRRNNYRRYR